MNLAKAGLVCLCKSDSVDGYVANAMQCNAMQCNAMQGKEGQGWAGQGRAGQVRAGQGKARPGSSGKAPKLATAGLFCLCRSHSMHEWRKVELSVSSSHCSFVCTICK